MTEDSGLPNIPEAEIAPKRPFRISVVWFIPLLAALAGIGVAVQQYLSEGPTIQIAFRSAEGVEAGKTPVKYKDIEIGQVTGVRLSDDYSRILVTVKMEKSVEKLLVGDAKFWIVKPRVTLSGVSGIGTLLSGNYVRFEPGKSGTPGRDFTGLETPPAVTQDIPGKEFRLRAETLGSLGVGSPVYYRRLSVGQVISSVLSPDGKSIDIRIFLNAPYDKFVTSNTRFWEASGVDVTAGVDGFNVRTESFLSLLIGGIAFETPPSLEGYHPVTENSVFQLAGDRTAAMSPQEGEADIYALHFDEQLRGLSVGAPVNFLGMPVGEVTEVRLEFDSATESMGTRVDIVAYPYRFLRDMKRAGPYVARNLPSGKRRELMQRQVVGKGLRAQLRSGSLLSGQLYVALDYFPEAPQAMIDWSSKPPRLPTVPGESTVLRATLASILAKIDNVPLVEIGNDTRQTIQSLDRTLRLLEGETLPGAKKTFATLDRTLTRFDNEILPETRKALEELRKAAATAERALGNADEMLLAPDAPGRQELLDALRETARAAQAVRLLADSLERNPSAVIRGRKPETAR